TRRGRNIFHHNSKAAERVPRGAVRNRGPALIGGPSASRSRDQLLLLFRPLAPLSERVHLGAVRERRLRGLHVFGSSCPALQRRRLQGAAIAEGQAPRSPNMIYGVEICGGRHICLSAGKEGDARNRDRNRTPQDSKRRLGVLLRPSLMRVLLSRNHHIGLEHHSFEKYARVI